MNSLPENKKNALRENILSLAMQCPVEHSNPEDCPLFYVRKMELPRRLEWFNSLTEDDLVYLNSYHCVCANIKIQACLAHSDPEAQPPAGSAPKFLRP
jgi:hypothetical protein